MEWKLTSDRPLYIQLLEQIQLRIITGCYKPGDKLPSVRDLAAEASVNPNTMQKALAELERTELVTAQRTSGRFITTDVQAIEDIKQQIAIGYGKEFVNKMRTLGYSGEQACLLVNQIEGDEML